MCMISLKAVVRTLISTCSLPSWIIFVARTNVSRASVPLIWSLPYNFILMRKFSSLVVFWSVVWWGNSFVIILARLELLCGGWSRVWLSKAWWRIIGWHFRPCNVASRVLFPVWLFNVFYSHTKFVKDCSNVNCSFSQFKWVCMAFLELYIFVSVYVVKAKNVCLCIEVFIQYKNMCGKMWLRLPNTVSFLWVYLCFFYSPW